MSASGESSLRLKAHPAARNVAAIPPRRLAMIREQLHDAIRANPGVTVAQLREMLPRASRSRINNALAELRHAGAVEKVGHGQYRIPERRSPVDGQQIARGQPLRLLMAGR